MDYVIVLVAHIEEPGQLAETVRAIRDAGIPHLDRHIHLAVDHVADTILSEFDPDRVCYVELEEKP